MRLIDAFCEIRLIRPSLNSARNRNPFTSRNSFKLNYLSGEGAGEGLLGRQGQRQDRTRPWLRARVCALSQTHLTQCIYSLVLESQLPHKTVYLMF